MFSGFSSWFSGLFTHKSEYSEPLSHPESFVTFEQLGKYWHPFKPTFHYEGTYINQHHRFFAECPQNAALIDIGIKGYLLPADALKLYELAYFSRGDVLELGCYHGLSTYILAQAICDSGARKRLISNDLYSEAVSLAGAVLQKHHYDRFSEFRCGDAAVVCEQLIKDAKHFDLVFVDHSHTYEAVTAMCKLLGDLVSPGGMCIFHDYNNEWNADPNNHDYGVWQAVQEHLPADLFEFYGSYGCTGLFRRNLSQIASSVHTEAA
jgi:predicted O-methyltransferase YrrM